MALISYKVDRSECTFKCRDICPLCGKIIFPEIRTYTCSPDFSKINAILLCPSCFTEYFERFERSMLNAYTYCSYEAYPYALPTNPIPDNIKNDFPLFYKIYEEASTAEAHNLHEICGMGYRKALEALVKHYAIKLFPNDKDGIEAEMLMPTIRRFASDKIVKLATAATWLGNDQVHLITKHPEYDIEQLKSFILALCQYIEYETLIEKATLLLDKSQNPK